MGVLDFINDIGIFQARERMNGKKVIEIGAMLWYYLQIKHKERESQERGGLFISGFHNLRLKYRTLGLPSFLRAI